MIVRLSASVFVWFVLAGSLCAQNSVESVEWVEGQNGWQVRFIYTLGMMGESAWLESPEFTVLGSMEPGQGQHTVDYAGNSFPCVNDEISGAVVIKNFMGQEIVRHQWSLPCDPGEEEPEPLSVVIDDVCKKPNGDLKLTYTVSDAVNKVEIIINGHVWSNLGVNAGQHTAVFAAVNFPGPVDSLTVRVTKATVTAEASTDVVGFPGMAANCADEEPEPEAATTITLDSLCKTPTPRLLCVTFTNSAALSSGSILIYDSTKTTLIKTVSLSGESLQVGQHKACFTCAEVTPDTTLFQIKIEGAPVSGVPVLAVSGWVSFRFQYVGQCVDGQGPAPCENCCGETTIIEEPSETEELIEEMEQHYWPAVPTYDWELPFCVAELVYLIASKLNLDLTAPEEDDFGTLTLSGQHINAAFGGPIVLDFRLDQMQQSWPEIYYLIVFIREVLSVYIMAVFAVKVINAFLGVVSGVEKDVPMENPYE